MLKLTFVGEGIPGGKADIFKFVDIRSVQNCEIFVQIRLISKLQFKQGSLQGKHCPLKLKNPGKHSEHTVIFLESSEQDEQLKIGH